MISHEYDQRGFVEILFFKGFKDSAYSIIKGSDLSCEFSSSRVFDMLETCKIFRVRLEEIDRLIVSIIPAFPEVRRVVSEVEEEGVIL